MAGDASLDPPPDEPPAVDRRVDGERKSVDLGTVEAGFEVAGERVSVTATLDRAAVPVHVTGSHVSVELRGAGTVAFYHEGAHTTLVVDERIDLLTPVDDGVSTSVRRESFDVAVGPDPSELVRRTRREALDELGLFGVDRIRYQEPAPDRERCRFCGREADAVVYRRQERILSLFGVPVVLDEGGRSDQCEHCAVRVDEADFDEYERRTVYE